MVWGSIAFPALEAASNSSGLVPAIITLLEAATTPTRPQTDAQGRIVLTPRWTVKGKGKGKMKTGGCLLHLVERGPVGAEYAALWRHKFTLTALQVQMVRRSAPWRDEDFSEERNQEINQVLAAATSMWIQSLRETVWPNIVFTVSLEIRHRSRSDREEACLICHQKYEFAGKNMEHNLFHCCVGEVRSWRGATGDRQRSR
jgi:hypothetical protein